MRRRKFLTAAGVTATTAGFAGCTAGSGVDGSDPLSVATYSSFVDAPSDSPGEWIKDEFEARHDVEFEWVVPDSPINHFIERHNAGVDIDAEVYMGIKPNELVRVDENTDGELFQATDIGALEHGENIGEEFFFDPQERMVPAYSSYAALVYDGREFERPETFEDLLDERFEGRFGVSNPAEGSNTGLYFLLWTINEFGTEGDYTWLDYWNELLENDVRILGSWGELYSQFDTEPPEIPAIVSYSNDRVYARRFGNDLDKHQVSLLNGQGYANLNAMGRFAQGTDDELAHRFMEFVLEPETQAKIAELNVTGPVNTEATPPEVYREFAQEPDEIVFFGYDELMGNLEGWISEWEREIVGSR